MKQKLYMMVWEIDVDKGGMTRVMLNRSSLLSEEYDSFLVTLDFNINYAEIRQKLVEMGRLDPGVGLLNPYEYYREKLSKSDVTSAQKNLYNKKASIFEKGYDVQDDEFKEKRYMRYFREGVYAFYKKWDSSGNLVLIDYFDNYRNRTSREEFLPNGLMYRKTYYDLNKNKPKQEILYTNDGNWYLNRWIKSNGEIPKVFLKNSREGKVKVFNSNREFHTHWIGEICKGEEIKPIMICDGPGSAIKLLNADSELVYKMFTVHSNHFDAPHKVGSALREDHRELIENIHRMDALIVLTDIQKQHLQEQFGPFERIHVIPNYAEKSTVSEKNENSRTISIISRLHEEKRIDLAIKAFSKVLSVHTEAVLEIHGAGPEQENLENLIKEMKIGNNVFLKGYTSDVDKIYSNSLVTLLTSKYEGFSLAIMESMANGTPVIAFDVLYSPDILIKDGKTGFLVADQDIEAMANRVIQLLENPAEAIRMGRQAKEMILAEYNAEEHKEAWLELLSQFK